MKYDVFISHHVDSTNDYVWELAEHLESSEINLKCWFCERDVRGVDDYTDLIPKIMSNTKMIVVLINKFANHSDQILREAKYAMKNHIPVLLFKIDDCKLTQNFEYIGSNSNTVNISSLDRQSQIETIIQEILYACENTNQCLNLQNINKERKSNDIEFFGYISERERLKIQREFLYDFSVDTYKKIFIKHIDSASKKKVYFLDLGCNSGEMAHTMLDGFANPFVYIGIDKEKAAIEQGRVLFPESHFYCGDCEATEFDQLLSSIEDELGIVGFDIINISMLILHLKEPSVFLDKLYEHIANDGHIIIIDIDDGLNIAYPDKHGNFRKSIELCQGAKYSGCRKSGRQILKMLYDIDVTEIALEKMGVSTVGMDRIKRRDFFEIYFWFIKDDYERMHNEYPDDAIIASDYKWLCENYEKMRLDFSKKDFFFNLGFLLFTAQK